MLIATVSGETPQVHACGVSGTSSSGIAMSVAAYAVPTRARIRRSAGRHGPLGWRRARRSLSSAAAAFGSARVDASGEAAEDAVVEAAPAAGRATEPTARAWDGASSPGVEQLGQPHDQPRPGR